jgi:hypothetical protein
MQMSRLSPMYVALTGTLPCELFLFHDNLGDVSPAHPKGNRLDWLYPVESSLLFHSDMDRSLPKIFHEIIVHIYCYLL